ncbi:MAG: hypothetical protein V4449_03665 [Patescibacteria group bacterium]
MQDKQSIAVLMDLLKKYPLTTEEKDAISNAIGILSWSSLAESKIQGLKERKNRRTSP